MDEFDSLIDWNDGHRVSEPIVIPRAIYFVEDRLVLKFDVARFFEPEL